MQIELFAFYLWAQNNAAYIYVYAVQCQESNSEACNLNAIVYAANPSDLPPLGKGRDEHD